MLTDPAEIPVTCKDCAQDIAPDALESCDECKAPLHNDCVFTWSRMEEDGFMLCDKNLCAECYEEAEDKP